MHETTAVDQARGVRRVAVGAVEGRRRMVGAADLDAVRCREPGQRFDRCVVEHQPGLGSARGRKRTETRDRSGRHVEHQAVVARVHVTLRRVGGPGRPRPEILRPVAVDPGVLVQRGRRLRRRGAHERRALGLRARGLRSGFGGGNEEREGEQGEGSKHRWGERGARKRGERNTSEPETLDASDRRLPARNFPGERFSSIQTPLGRGSSRARSSRSRT